MKNTNLHSKMALRFVLLILLLCAVGMTNSYAEDYDFSAVCSTGQTLYYRITNSNSHEVQLTYPNYRSFYHSNNNYQVYFWYDYERPTGDIIIPDFVEYAGVSYAVVSIRNNAFGDSSNSIYHHGGCPGITSITIPSSVITIGDDAFAKCTGLTSVTIPNSVTSIGEYAFSGCSGLTSISIPNSITTISRGTFGGCTSLISIIIPNSVTSIGDYAFYGCNSLAEITSLNSQPPTIGGSSCFDNVNKTIPVYIPLGSTSAYQSAYGWSAFNNFVEVISSFSVTCSTAILSYFLII